MIEVMPESQGKVFGVKMSGKITAREYEDVIIPVEEFQARYGDRIGVLDLHLHSLWGLSPGCGLLRRGRSLGSISGQPRVIPQTGTTSSGRPSSSLTSTGWLRMPPM